MSISSITNGPPCSTCRAALLFMTISFGQGLQPGLFCIQMLMLVPADHPPLTSCPADAYAKDGGRSHPAFGLSQPLQYAPGI